MNYCLIQLFFFLVELCGNIQAGQLPSALKPATVTSAATKSNARGAHNSTAMGIVQMGSTGHNPNENVVQCYLPMQELQLYDQMTILAREPGSPLPPIKNPGLVITDVTMPLIEGTHYNPEEFVIHPGKDLFKQGQLLALYGKFLLIVNIIINVVLKLMISVK